MPEANPIDPFSPITIRGHEFKNRIWRSSVGGRHATYDGAVTEAWRNFEVRFAQGGVGGIISTTFHVNQNRLSPMQYPSIAHDRFVGRIDEYIADIKSLAPGGCQYIIQVGDPGYVTYESLFTDKVDSRSASWGIDLAFGYRNTRRAMTVKQIDDAIDGYVEGARRAQEAGADGVEITAAKGYLIQQFLNPGFNRRKDGWGGDPERRFRFFREVVERTRDAVSSDFIVGVRMSGIDYNYLPWQFALFRYPSPFWPFGRNRGESFRIGNGLEQMKEYAKRIKEHVDYLHIVSGLGFPSPRITPGKFPYDEVRIFFNSTRHLSGKAALRAFLLNLPPARFWRWMMNLGWSKTEAINLAIAREFKTALGADFPIIVNGGFQDYGPIAGAISEGIDVVSMARALLANPDLPKWYENNSKPADFKPCSRCNKCVARTATSPLGCYDEVRYNHDVQEMYRQILAWNRQDVPAFGMDEFRFDTLHWPLFVSKDEIFGPAVSVADPVSSVPASSSEPMTSTEPEPAPVDEPEHGNDLTDDNST